MDKGKSYSNGGIRKLTIKKKLIWTCFIHLINATLYYFILKFNNIYSFLGHFNVGHIGSKYGTMPLVWILYILPPLIITFIWFGIETTKLSIAMKFLLSFQLIINFIFTIVYIYFIYKISGYTYI